MCPGFLESAVCLVLFTTGLAAFDNRAAVKGTTLVTSIMTGLSAYAEPKVKLSSYRSLVTLLWKWSFWAAIYRYAGAQWHRVAQFTKAVPS